MSNVVDRVTALFVFLAVLNELTTPNSSQNIVWTIYFGDITSTIFFWFPSSVDFI